MNIRVLLAFFWITLSFLSCKSQKGNTAYVYRNEIDFDTINEHNMHVLDNFYTYKKLTFLNDTVIEFTVHLDHIVTGAIIPYSLVNNSLKVDTLDVKNERKFNDEFNKIFGVEFEVHQDSLIDKRTGEVYYLTKSKKY